MARKRRASEAIEEEEQQVVVDSDQDAGGVGAAEDDDEVLDVVDDSDEELEKEMRALGMLPAPAEATKRPPKLDAGGLARRLEQIAVTLQGSAHYLPFIETLCVVADQPMPSVDANDDFAREKAFAEQALSAIASARPLILATGTKFARPDDFFAEMVKDDVHMARVRQRLADIAASMKRADDVAKLRKAKKYGKAVQVEKQQEKQKRKTQELERLQLVKKRKLGGLGANDDGDDEFGISLDDNVDGPAQGGMGAQKGRFAGKKKGGSGRGGAKASAGSRSGGGKPFKRAKKGPDQSQKKRPGKAARGKKGKKASK